jgi:hypothetical protein
VAPLEARREVERAGLLADRLDDLGVAVAGVAAPQAGAAVDQAAAVEHHVVHALGPGDQARVRLEVPVRGVRHPEGFEVVGRCQLAGQHHGAP